jgi:site-specific recombinase XerD
MIEKPHPLGPFVRRFLLEHVVADRGLSRNTQKSYRDAIRLLLRFLAHHYSVDATRLTVEQLTVDALRAFLVNRQEEHPTRPSPATIVWRSFIRSSASQRVRRPNC